MQRTMKAPSPNGVGTVPRWTRRAAIAALVCVGFMLQAAIGEEPAQPAKPPQKVAPIRLAKATDGIEAVVLFNPKSRLLTLTLVPPDGTTKIALPMRERANRWKPLLAEFLAKRPPDEAYQLVVGDYPELAPRLAVAALRSGDWDSRAGRLRNGDTNEGIRKAIESERICLEVSQLFDALGYTAKVDSVENVILCRWKEIPDAQLPADVAAPDLNSLVPCGASLLFRVTKKQQLRDSH